ncbi:patatin-like phospholipase family protein [Phycicoccus sp. CSK15P-2]|uniref:patatin-like phospholipase family protein n=1 Tax=Phycicoccus sp. CSK15P-2 TaxID=2807627 RepID=UPI00194ED384|nr:patatin-like phospholipase family protein [Phycicoccus sp. CSK15P-2]MBM6404416.1 patatin-like phospholipase family protein [Phycicoccus sp. CSK15P-2]
MGGRVAVALGAGGARGYAHIGVLQVLEERGYEVVAVAGTSMGALVGGLAAAGRLDAYTEWVTGLTQYDVWRLLDINPLGGGGAIRAERIFTRVGEILDGALIEDCAVPFTAVATDLNHRREVWFQRGPMATAIRASVAIPSLVTPIVVDGRLLVDGGLMNPVPIEPTAAVMSDLTIAVSLQAGHSTGMPVAPVRTPGALVGSVRSLTERVGALIGGSHDHARAPEQLVGGGVDDGVARDVEPVTEGGGSPAVPSAPGYTAAPKELASAEIFNRSFDTMAALITRYRMASNPPDVLVSVPSDACRTMDFHRAGDMITLGRELTVRALDEAGY